MSKIDIIIFTPCPVQDACTGTLVPAEGETPNAPGYGPFACDACAELHVMRGGCPGCGATYRPCPCDGPTESLMLPQDFLTAPAELYPDAD